ncbi:Lipopolysaccharide heptosyltransferase II [Desulfamplus magnetovallimortis]|uniref:lipopolysaccharide heptosyltransferase II n=1 Tax=Desulfamplus magnetovallimortis TaxID=1246637 RepID=A0A1W1H8M7_9BACT|nr:lipopolysaccharide heptosyltransferase II [Desulfamplus magnetovallimortis]SLM28745.1 Lipopolysaccharide heptosyltransferase II [Desulfamplus magnetovallimortis]
MNNNNPSKILIRAANWVGDAIMTTPVIRAIRKHYPSAHISLLAKPWVIPVFEHNPHVDEIIVYENDGRHKKGWGTICLARDLRKYRFDIAILMQNAFEAALITFLAGIPVRIGYNTDGRTLLLNPSIKMDKKLKKGHLIDYYRGILKGASIADNGGYQELFVTDNERAKAKRFLEDNGIADYAGTGRAEQPVIGLNPGATGGTAKRWFPQRYAELARKLSDCFNVKILLFGGPGDEALGDFINSCSGNVCINLAGHTSLRDAFALIEKCSLFITNDSGLMHVAAALHTPQIAIIGSTDPVATSPASYNSRMLRVQVPCSPCLKPHCPVDHACMDKISVDMVMDAAMAKMAEQ